MNIAALAVELAAGHPGTGAYNADDALAAAELNAANRTRIVGSMSGDAIFAATDEAEFNALTDAKKTFWMAFCGRDSIDPAGSANVSLVNWIYGAGSDTLTALAAARTETISRATELGLGVVRVGNVGEARA